MREGRVWDHTEQSPWSKDLGIPCQVWGGRNGSSRGDHSQKNMYLHWRVGQDDNEQAKSTFWRCGPFPSTVKCRI